MRPKVLIDIGVKVDHDARARLARHVDLVELDTDKPYSADQLISALDGLPGLISLGNRIPLLTRHIFASSPDLRIVGIRGDRFGNEVDLEAAAEYNIKVIDTDNIASSQPVAEWDLAMILICLRNAGAVYRQMIAGEEKWANTPNDGFVSGELTGKRVGLIGCGHVGQRLVELLLPFHVDLKVFDPYLDKAVIGRLNIVQDELEAVLQHAQILVVQVPHTPKTEKMIGDAELELLGKGAIIVNCSRGPILDQQALIARVEAGELIAGLDVFDPEPLPQDSKLRHLPNAFITPHIAWYAPEALTRYYASMVEEFERFFTGQSLHYELTQRMVDIRQGQM